MTRIAVTFALPSESSQFLRRLGNKSRTDRKGISIVHGTIGRRSFDADKLQGNLAALVDALNKAKPATSKGVYLRKVAVSSTMGLGVRVDTQTISA